MMIHVLYIFVLMQMIMTRVSPEEYISATIELYLDIINLFIEILKILERVNRKDVFKSRLLSYPFLYILASDGIVYLKGCGSESMTPIVTRLESDEKQPKGTIFLCTYPLNK